MIDGSSLSRLVEARARPLLSIHGRLRPKVAAELPTLDAELEAAGFGGRPPTGLGERAWLLRQLLGYVRPARWTEWLGAKSSTLVAHALRSDEARPILEGWAEAATRFADAEWLAALIAEPQVRAAISLDLRRLVATLPAERRAAVAARVGASADPATLAWLAALTRAIWPQPVTDAVLGAIRKLSADEYPDQALYDLVRAAAVGLDPRRGDELAAVASHDDAIRPALIGAIDTMSLRERMYAAFASLPPVTPSHRST
jgi:hypothetical protein